METISSKAQQYGKKKDALMPRQINKGMGINDNPALEPESDLMGAKVLLFKADVGKSTPRINEIQWNQGKNRAIKNVTQLKKKMPNEAGSKKEFIKVFEDYVMQNIKKNSLLIPSNN